MATAKKVAKKGKAVAKKKPAITKQSRRPDVNDGPSLGSVTQIMTSLHALKEAVEDYAAHMRALDRKRLNGVGVKKQGFIERTYEVASENPEFLPHWLTLNKFNYDLRLFVALRKLFDMNKQVSELIWNLVMQASDMAYTDALEYYALVREAAKRRVDAAETIYNELVTFFKSHGRRTEDEPTESELKRDINSLLHGKKDGKIVIENISPKVSKGERKVVDETFKRKGAFKESEEGEVE